MDENKLYSAIMLSAGALIALWNYESSGIEKFAIQL